MPRPHTVWWEGDDTIVVSGTKRLEFSKWTEYVRRRMDELDDHIEEEILFNLFTLNEIEELFGVSKLSSDEEMGEGILFDARNPTFDNPQSVKFMGRLFMSGSLGVSVQTKPDGKHKFHFNKKKVQEWILAIHKAWAILQPLCHILQGPGGRLTEECAYSPIRNESGSSNIFVKPQFQTGGFYSRYHKNLRTTGSFKHIERILPYPLWRNLYILSRLVRPIELMVLFEYIVPFDKQQSTADAYRNHVFASCGTAWTPDFASEMLFQFVQEAGFGYGMKVRELRHLTIAIQRRKLDYQKRGNPEDIALAVAAEEMCGHSLDVGEYHYAREKGTIGTASQEDLFMRIGHDWHKLFQVSTSYRNTALRLKKTRDPEQEATGGDGVGAGAGAGGEKVAEKRRKVRLPPQKKLKAGTSSSSSNTQVDHDDEHEPRRSGRKRKASEKMLEAAGDNDKDDA